MVGLPQLQIPFPAATPPPELSPDTVVEPPLLCSPIWEREGCSFWGREGESGSARAAPAEQTRGLADVRVVATDDRRSRTSLRLAGSANGSLLSKAMARKTRMREGTTTKEGRTAVSKTIAKSRRSGVGLNVSEAELFSAFVKDSA